MKHTTHKATARGKAMTMERKAKRAIKRASRPLDVDRILSTLPTGIRVA